MPDRSKLAQVAPEYFNETCAAFLPGYFGVLVKEIGNGEVKCELAVKSHHLSPPHGFLHGATLLTLADTACGVGCFAFLPEGASSHTTIEGKVNFVASAKDGTIACTAKAVHQGRSTQVWDATLVHKESGRTLAIYRCTQLIVYPKT